MQPVMGCPCCCSHGLPLLRLQSHAALGAALASLKITCARMSALAGTPVPRAALGSYT